MEVKSVFAYAALVYILACAFYMWRTQAFGTPFKDSLTEEQLELKNESAKKRCRAFMEGAILGALVAGCVRPF